MTTEAELLRELAADEAAASSHMLDLVAAIALLNDELRPIEAAKKRAVDELKQLMALDDLTEVRDGERGITAKIQERRGTPTFDLVSAVQAGVSLTEAATAGMLKLDHAALSLFRKNAGATWADALAKYEVPGTGSVALLVERDKQ